MKRTFRFAKEVRVLSRKLFENSLLRDDLRQVIRSSGSIGANYREAQRAVSRKDFILKSKYCLREAEESKFWLDLIQSTADYSFQEEISNLQKEVHELVKIFQTIVNRAEAKRH